MMLLEERFGVYFVDEKCSSFTVTSKFYFLLSLQQEYRILRGYRLWDVEKKDLFEG
jgi:hypothetical protein